MSYILIALRIPSEIVGSPMQIINNVKSQTAESLVARKRSVTLTIQPRILKPTKACKAVILV